jgi:hypothetical protein
MAAKLLRMALIMPGLAERFRVDRARTCVALAISPVRRAGRVATLETSAVGIANIGGPRNVRTLIATGEIRIGARSLQLNSD